MNFKKAKKAIRESQGGRLLLVLVAVLFMLASDAFGQNDYEISLTQRRMGDEIGVEIWIKSLNSTAVNLGNASVAVVYDTTYLAPVDPGSYDFTVSDSVNYDVNVASPYVALASAFNNANGYGALKAQAANIGGIYVYQLDVVMSSVPSTLGVQPSTSGRGSLIGRLKFAIRNHASITSTTNTGIDINTSTLVGDLRIFDASGNDKESVTNLATTADFTVRGISILNPNGPNEAVNRNKSYPSLSVSGYPIYFERSGLIEPAAGSEYGSDVLAYTINYSTDNGSNWSAEVARISESREDSTDLTVTQWTYKYSGEVVFSATSGSRYIITQGDGSQLPVVAANYGGVLRFIWQDDQYFAPRSEQALLQICQLDTAGRTADIDNRTQGTGNTCGQSDNSFVLSRLFFLQLDGTSTYLRTRDEYSNATQLTVEAWVNLNSIPSDTTAEPGIVVTGPGPADVNEEGAWMLYLSEGKYPAFRCLEIEGRGDNGTPYLATVISPDSLVTTSDAVPINANSAHPGNWTHIAATVENNVVSLYVNGELMATKTNTNANNIRMDTKSHPVWVGVNPTGGISATDYLHAGVKEVRVWRKALTQRQIRTNIPGVVNPATASSSDIRSALEIYYDLVGTSSDLANAAIQNGTNPIYLYDSPDLTATAVSTLSYRPDQGHVKLTSPSTGSGVTNLENKYFPIRWAAYGVGDNTTGTSADLVVEFSRDGGTQWAVCIDDDPVGNLLDDVEVENGNGQVMWEPYKHAGIIGAYNELQAVDPGNGAVYNKDVLMRIRGTNAHSQQDISFTTGTFKVAPYFSIKNTGESIIVVPSSTTMNLTGGAAFVEAWIRPYRFPTADEGYFPIINKKDTTTGTGHYAFRLLSTGQLEFEITTSTGTVLSAKSDTTRPIIGPNVDEMDSTWTHVGVFVNLANGSGSSSVIFYIDGTPHYEGTLTSQFGSDVAVNSTNTYPTYIAYEKGADSALSFIGEIKGVRFWNGAPAGQSFTGTEPTALTNFIRGAMTVRAEDLSTAYQTNLVASFDMNGGSFVAYDKPYNSTFSTFSSTDSVQAQIIANNGLSYEGVEPYIKLVEPVFDQQVPNTTTDLLVRWVGFDYDRDGFTGGNSATSQPSDLEYSTKGGGDIDFTPFNVTSSIYDDNTYDPNSFIPALTNTYKFQGTAPPLSQFGGDLDVSLANGNDGTPPRTSISATLRNGKLRLSGRATINSAAPVSFASYSNLRSEGPLFTITPPSNFTVRVLLEGYHQGAVTGITGTLGTTYATNGLRVTLYDDVNGAPSAQQAQAESSQGYSATDPLNLPRGTNGSEFANVPFVFTAIDDGSYFVVVEHPNHLPIMSRYAAPFKFDGDDISTWAISSGWDFQNWTGTTTDVITEANSLTDPPNFGTSYTAYGYSETDPGLTDYGATGLAYNDGQTSSSATSGIALPAMVAGDVVKDGKINAADRVQVRVDNGGTTLSSDVTGDGIINSIDRDIVDKNNNRTSSIADIFPTLSIEAPYDPYEVVSRKDIALSEIMNIQAKQFDENGKISEALNNVNKKGNMIQSGGIMYRVSAEAALVEEDQFVELTMYIQNEGQEFAPGNCTFAVTYDPNVLIYETLYNIEDNPWSNLPSLGYIGKVYSAPQSQTNNPLPNVRSIEIDYDGYTRKLGNNVPYEKTLMGTLRFKVRDSNKEIAFDWNKATAILRTDGLNVTGDGIFDIIKSLNTVETAMILSPNGGEIWRAGRLYTISWTRPTDDLPVNIERSIDGGITWEVISEKPVSIFDTEFDWFTPLISSAECLVRIVDATTGTEIDRTDNLFSILPANNYITRPSSSDAVYTGGTVDVIQWSADDPATVRFEFSPNGEDGWVKVTADVNSQSGQVQWTVPQFINTKNAVVAMIDIKTGEYLAVSEPFRILAGALTLITPRESSVLAINQKTPVRWLTDNNVKRFDLEFTPDGGNLWLPIDNGLNALKGSYSWTVPNVPYTETAQLRALWNNDPDMEYSRSPIFTIDGNTSVKTGGEYVFNVDRPYPNPFNNETNIEFTLPADVQVYAEVFNQAGVRVVTIANGEMFSSGTHILSLSGSGLSTGVYYIRINAGVDTAIREVILAK